jgi:hypothetical protein
MVVRNLVAHAGAVGAALFFLSSATAQSSTPFVPEDFAVPEKLETKEFRLRMLTVNDAPPSRTRS